MQGAAHGCIVAQFLGIDLANRDEWYEGGGAYGKTKYEIGAGMVEMYQSQAMWNNRQHPKVSQRIF